MVAFLSRILQSSNHSYYYFFMSRARAPIVPIPEVKHAPVKKKPMTLAQLVAAGNYTLLMEALKQSQGRIEEENKTPLSELLMRVPVSPQNEYSASDIVNYLCKMGEKRKLHLSQNVYRFLTRLPLQDKIRHLVHVKAVVYQMDVRSNKLGLLDATLATDFDDLPADAMAPVTRDNIFFTLKPAQGEVLLRIRTEEYQPGKVNESRVHCKDSQCRLFAIHFVSNVNMHIGTLVAMIKPAFLANQRFQRADGQADIFAVVRALKPELCDFYQEIDKLGKYTYSIGISNIHHMTSAIIVVPPNIAHGSRSFSDVIYSLQTEGRGVVEVEKIVGEVRREEEKRELPRGFNSKMVSYRGKPRAHLNQEENRHHLLVSLPTRGTLNPDNDRVAHAAMPLSRLLENGATRLLEDLDENKYKPVMNALVNELELLYPDPDDWKQFKTLLIKTRYFTRTGVNWMELMEAIREAYKNVDKAKLANVVLDYLQSSKSRHAVRLVLKRT